MVPKPAHLGPDYAAQFQDAAVAGAYHTRPPYPEAVFDLLETLAVEPRVALDVGCGTGDIARRLARRVRRVDAVDLSAAMIEVGQRQPGGGAANLRWQVAGIEEATLAPPYGLAVAGESLHWMDWQRALPTLAAALAPGAPLVIVERAEQPAPWSADLLGLIVRYSTNKEFQPYDLIAELERRGLFAPVGETVTAAEPLQQRVGDYIESIHSRNGFSRDRMAPADAAAFDAAVAALLAPHAPGGAVALRIAARLYWGRPLARDG